MASHRRQARRLAVLRLADTLRPRLDLARAQLIPIKGIPRPKLMAAVSGRFAGPMGTTWSQTISPDAAYRRAGGRRRYNAERPTAGQPGGRPEHCRRRTSRNRALLRGPFGSPAEAERAEGLLWPVGHPNRREVPAWDAEDSLARLLRTVARLEVRYGTRNHRHHRRRPRRNPHPAVRRHPLTAPYRPLTANEPRPNLPGRGSLWRKTPPRAAARTMALISDTAAPRPIDWGATVP
jgi:hypothetical protein